MHRLQWEEFKLSARLLHFHSALLNFTSGPKKHLFLLFVLQTQQHVRGVYFVFSNLSWPKPRDDFHWKHTGNGHFVALRNSKDYFVKSSQLEILSNESSQLLTSEHLKLNAIHLGLHFFS